MYGSTTVRVKKRMTSRHELTLSEKLQLIDSLESRLTDNLYQFKSEKTFGRFKKN
jgi:hypothetical protein